jgi:hypothetical protein
MSEFTRFRVAPAQGRESRQARLWPRLQFDPPMLCRSSIPEPYLARVALAACVSRWKTPRARLLRMHHAILARAPPALVLAEGRPAAILALAPDALVLADG